MEHLTKTLIPEYLRAIPQSNQNAQTIPQIMGDDLDDETLAMLVGYAFALQTLGVVQIKTGETFAQMQIQAASQTAKYALISLASYVESGEQLITDWHTRGVQNLPDDKLLDRGAKLLYAMEAQRIDRIPDAPPSRIVKVAQVLIKRTNPKTGQPELLFQYDANAGHYQLIGGRWSERDGDDMLKTIVREIDEELEASDIQHQRDYQLQLIAGDVSPTPTLSPTFGALSKYHFWFYHMTDLKKTLTLQEDDQWVPVQQVLGGYVINDEDEKVPFSFTEIYEAMDKAVPGGLLKLSDSFA